MNKGEIDSALRQIAAGDNDAFARLYTETRRGVYAFLFSYFRDSADCEDVMQTTYLKIKQNIGQYQPGTNGLSWILQIAKNTALNELRSRSARRKLEETAMTVTEDDRSCDSMETRFALMEILKRELDEEEQRIVILHVLWGYKHREIAGILQCPLGTVTSRYKRAAAKLRAAWKEAQA